MNYGHFENNTLQLPSSRSFLEMTFWKDYLACWGQPLTGYSERVCQQACSGCASKEMSCFNNTEPASCIDSSMTFPEWYLRSRAHLHLGLSPWPYGLNIKRITALYLDSHMPFLGSSPDSLPDFSGRTVQIGVSVPSLVFIIH